MARSIEPLPAWVQAVLMPGARFETEAEAIDATVELATESARSGGGPFGALVATQDLEVVAVGWNRVIETQDSTAHAEIVALRAAQARLGTHDLATVAPQHGPLVLWTSCAPCIQCFGALYWSGIGQVVAAARADQAEALGFQEGPVTPALWEAAAEEKGITFRQATGTLDPQAPFRAYEEAGGALY